MEIHWTDAMARSMQQASVPYGVLDPHTGDWRTRNAALVQLLQQHSLASGTPQALCMEQLQPALAQCVATGQEQVHVWESTQTRLVLVPVVEDGAMAAIQCFAQQEAGVQVQRLEDTLHSLPLGVWLAKPDGEIYWINRFNSCYREGVDQAAYFSASAWLEQVYPEDIPVCAAAYTKSVLKGKVDPFEIRMYLADGTLHWFAVDGHPVYNPDGSIDRWIGITQDIQHVKDAQAAAAQQITQLQQLLEAEKQQAQRLHAELSQIQKMDVLGQLAGNVAHDFNNLLFVIRLNTSMLVRQTQEPKVLEFAELIQQDVARAAHTATQLMTFSGRQPQHPRAYEIATLLADIQVLLQHAIGAEVDFRMELDEGVGAIEVDKTYFENALINLAVNARDAVAASAGRPGLVRIRVQSVQTAHAGAHPGWVHIAVHDNGTGMSAAIQARMMEPFFTTKAPGKGTGLGMGMVQRFVDQAGGVMQVQSALGEGTTVSLYLPPATRQVVADTREAAVLASGRESENVLVIEDELEVRNAVARVLMAAGYTVSAAYSPEVALEYLRQGLRPALILSDVRMPGKISALQMVAQLEADGLLPAILFMTGYAPDGNLAQGLIAGRYPVVAKPVAAEVLLATVRQVLDGVSVPVPG